MDTPPRGIKCIWTKNAQNRIGQALRPFLEFPQLI
jgi:hypothetical protein